MTLFKAKRINEQYELLIGDRLEIRNNFSSEVDVVYAGLLPENKVFSFIYTEHDLGALKAQGNVYFPKAKNELTFAGKKFEVLNVDANAILLQYVQQFF